jgi:hypothetical protein
MSMKGREIAKKRQKERDRAFARSRRIQREDTDSRNAELITKSMSQHDLELRALLASIEGEKLQTNTINLSEVDPVDLLALARKLGVLVVA